MNKCRLVVITYAGQRDPRIQTNEREDGEGEGKKGKRGGGGEEGGGAWGRGGRQAAGRRFRRTEEDGNGRARDGGCFGSGVGGTVQETEAIERRKPNEKGKKTNEQSRGERNEKEVVGLN